MNLRKKFLLNNIPYDNIDTEMIELINLLNFKWGLQTKFSCYGHQLSESSYVVFNENTEENAIHNLVEYLHKDVPNDLNIYKHTKIYNWVRMSPVNCNWVLEIVPIPTYRKTEEMKRSNFEQVIDYLRKNQNKGVVV